GRQSHAGTPRPTQSRVTHDLVAGFLARGSSLPATFPGNATLPSGINGRRLTAYSCGGSRGIVRASTRTAFPIDPLREPTPSSLWAPGDGVNIWQRHDR